MKHISCLRDLGPYGIELLTGEACGAWYRILCDCNERGRKLISTAWGLPGDVKLQEPWNSKVDGMPSVGSILLGPEDYLTLGVFALLQSCKAVYRFYPEREIYESHRRLVAFAEQVKTYISAYGDKALANVATPNADDSAANRLIVALADDAIHGYGNSAFSPGTLLGVEQKDEDVLAAYLKMAKDARWTFQMWSLRSSAGDGTRYEHKMSGRVE